MAKNLQGFLGIGRGEVGGVEEDAEEGRIVFNGDKVTIKNLLIFGKDNAKILVSSN